MPIRCRVFFLPATISYSIGKQYVILDTAIVETANHKHIKQHFAIKALYHLPDKNENTSFREFLKERQNSIISNIASDANNARKGNCLN